MTTKSVREAAHNREAFEPILRDPQYKKARQDIATYLELFDNSLKTGHPDDVARLKKWTETNAQPVNWQSPTDLFARAIDHIRIHAGGVETRARHTENRVRIEMQDEAEAKARDDAARAAKAKKTADAASAQRKADSMLSRLAGRRDDDEPAAPAISGG